MSITTDENSPSSNISSDCQSPERLPSNKANQKIGEIIIRKSPDVIFASTLMHILSENKKSSDYFKKINLSEDGHFTFKIRPTISLLDYLRRILKYIKIECSTLIIAMIYIDRICKEKVFLNEYNIHRIMIIAIYMAYTYNEDCIYDNKYLSLVSGLSKSEMVLLEEDFLDLIDFKLFVCDEIFNQYKKFFL